MKKLLDDVESATLIEDDDTGDFEGNTDDEDEVDEKSPPVDHQQLEDVWMSKFQMPSNHSETGASDDGTD